MSEAERKYLIETIARKIDERARNWPSRNNDFASLYAAECSAIAAMVRGLSSADSDNPR